MSALQPTLTLFSSSSPMSSEVHTLKDAGPSRSRDDDDSSDSESETDMLEVRSTHLIFVPMDTLAPTDLIERIHHLRQKLVDRSKKCALLKEELTRAQDDKRKAESATKKLEIDLTDERAKHDHTGADMKKLQEKYEELKHKNKQLRRRIDALTETVADMRQQVTAQQHQLIAQQQQFQQQLTAQQQQFQQQLATQNQKLMDQTGLIRVMQDEISGLCEQCGYKKVSSSNADSPP